MVHPLLKYWYLELFFIPWFWDCIRNKKNLVPAVNFSVYFIAFLLSIRAISLKFQGSWECKMTLSVKRNLLSFPWNDITLCNIPWMDLPTHAHGTICLSPLSNVCCSIWDLFQPKQVPIELWFSWWSKWTANTGFSAVL